MSTEDKQYLFDVADIKDSPPAMGEFVAAAIRADMERRERELGIHPVCEGCYFVTNPETVKALSDHFEQMGTYLGMKVMVPRTQKDPAPTRRPTRGL